MKRSKSKVISTPKKKLPYSDKAHSKHPPRTSSPSQKTEADLVKREKTFWIFITVFFFSGLCGLIYEVVWSRLLTLVFGNTTYAISTVVGVFMFGLALGSYLCGKFLPKINHLLRTYALLEIGIGIYAALSIPLLSVVQLVHTELFPSIYSHPFLLNLIRILLSSLLLFFPTLFMGATMPLLSQALTRSPRCAGRDIGLLYSINTFGAAAGCFSSAFLLIPALGIQLTIYAGAGLNIFLGLLVWTLSKGLLRKDIKELNPSAASQNKAIGGSSRITDKQSIFVLYIFIASGFLALLYEVAWSRALILVFGTSIYAFATMLTTYLLGIAFGSIVLGRFTDRVHKPIVLLAILQMVIGASVFITTPIIGRLPDYFMTFFSSKNISWGTVTFTEFIVCFLIIIVPTFASGASFPLVTRILINNQAFKIGRSVAHVYAFNTLGGILGSLMTGFILIPTIGVEKTLLLGGGANFMIAFLLSIITSDIKKSARFAWGIGAVLTGITGIILLPSWNPKVLNSGVYMYGKTMANTSGTTDVNSFMSPYKLLYHREGSSATVTVFQRDKFRFLRVNGKTDGSNSSDNYTEIFLGILPIMYCKNPENVLVIGLGTGITLGSVLDYPVKKVDCIEISPEVVEASHYFNEDNDFALSSPTTQLHILDGRTWLMAMDETYDIITSEPSHPWQTGNANLFTVDFFKLAIKRLKKGGVFCQWLPIYQMEKEHFRLLVSSFKKVFPYVHIWMAATDALLVGSAEELPPINYTEFHERMDMPKINQRLAKLGVNTPEDFLSFFYLDNNAVNKFIEGVTGVNSDNYPVLEFSAPKYLLSLARPDTLLSFLNLSFESKLPLANVTDLSEFQQKRLNKRAFFLRQWRIPESIIQQMLSHN
jgi:spermidine synthase